MRCESAQELATRSRVVDAQEHVGAKYGAGLGLRTVA